MVTPTAREIKAFEHMKKVRERNRTQSDKKEREQDLVLKLRGVKALGIKAKRAMNPSSFAIIEEDETLQEARNAARADWLIMEG